MRRGLHLAWIAGVLAVVPAVAQAEEDAAKPDKSRYHLFRPTPKSQWRDLSTDRPDTTESANSVDAGAFQVEADAFSVSIDNDSASGDRVTHMSMLPMNVKLGLTDRLDLQLVLHPFEREEIVHKGMAMTEVHEGFGDTDLRLKMNLWGNDGGVVAVALMPFVTMPTDLSGLGNGHVEGGLIVPVGLSLPADFDVGLMVQGDFVRDPANEDYEAETLGSATVSHSIVGDFGAFAEIAVVGPPTRPPEAEVTANMGLLYALGESFQLDAGANVGLTEAADDIRIFVGASMRPF